MFFPTCSPMFDPAKTHVQYGSYVPWSPFMVGLGYGHPTMKLRLLDAHFSCSKSASWGYRFAPSQVMQVGSSKLAGSATPRLQKSLTSPSIEMVQTILHHSLYMLRSTENLHDMIPSISTLLSTWYSAPVILALPRGLELKIETRAHNQTKLRQSRAPQKMEIEIDRVWKRQVW